jgi:hypothetical protein
MASASGALDSPFDCPVVSSDLTDWLLCETSIEYPLVGEQCEDKVENLSSQVQGSPIGSYNREPGNLSDDEEGQDRDETFNYGGTASSPPLLAKVHKMARSEEIRTRKPNGERNREACKRFRSKVRQKRDRLVRQVLQVSAEVSKHPEEYSEPSVRGLRWLLSQPGVV